MNVIIYAFAGLGMLVTACVIVRELKLALIRRKAKKALEELKERCESFEAEQKEE